jgi:glycosyltransferase involved in cell wall biosynthesis
VRVLIDTPPFFIRPRNTDWLYMRSLADLAEHAPLEISFIENLWDGLQESAHYVGTRLGAVTRGPNQYLRSAPVVRAAARNVDVVISHRRFPLDVGKPVIWQHAILDPRMRIAKGETDAQIAADYVDHRRPFSMSSVIQVSTRAEAARHRQVFPEFGERFAAVPFFLPHIEPVADDDVALKHADDEILRLLFVGREAHRKGLDLLLAALALIGPTAGRRMSLDVVSAFSDGPMTLPNGIDVRVHRSLPREQVLQLMRDAHVFAMSSRFESFGFTFIEALANGCAVVGPDWEVQSEILDGGHAGVTITPQTAAIVAALSRLREDRGLRTDLARQGLERFRSSYSAAAVAAAYFVMIERAMDARSAVAT